MLQSFLHQLCFRCTCRYVYLVFDCAFLLENQDHMSNLKAQANPSWDVSLASVPTGFTSPDGFHGGKEGDWQFYPLQKTAFCCFPHIVRNKLFSHLQTHTHTQPCPFMGKLVGLCACYSTWKHFCLHCGCLITKTRSLIKIGLVVCISFKENHWNSICDSLPS